MRKKILSFMAMGLMAFSIPNIAQNTDSDIKKATLKVYGKCEMCKENIETAASGVEGVTSAQWDRKTRQLVLNYNPKNTSVENISKVIAKTGYKTEKDKADKEAYKNLPACCK